jgi:hypothetical protein
MTDHRPFPIWTARIDDQSKLVVRDVGRWAGFLSRLKGRAVEVQVRPERKRRSLNQNSWYWVAIVPAIQGYLNESRDLQLSEDQTHYVLKSSFIGLKETPLGPVPLESKTLSTQEFADYCEKIRSYAATEWKLPIPGPENYWNEVA